MPAQSVPEINGVHSAHQQQSRGQIGQQRRKTGRRDPKQNHTPRQKKDTVVIPPRQVEVDFNHASPQQQQQHKQQQENKKKNSNNNGKSKSKSSKNTNSPPSTSSSGRNSSSRAPPSLPNGQAPNFGTNGIVKAAAEAMLSPQSSNMEKYAGSSFQNEPKAITLPKPSFLRR